MASSEDEPAEVVDAVVVHDGDPPAASEIHSAAAPSAALVRRERRSEVLRPLDSTAVLESFNDYQKLLQQLLTSDDWQGSPNNNGSFVKKKGWRKIATAFDLDVQMIRSDVERDEHGKPLRAEVWARAVAPSGRSMDGDGYCSSDEPRFASQSGRQKLENDLRATATTRAMNRAISGLVGMGAVSAEETDGTTPGAQASGPKFGPAANAKVVEQTEAAIAYVLTVADPDVDYLEIEGIVRKISTSTAKEMPDMYLPYIACRAIGLLAGRVKELREASADESVDEAERAAAEEGAGADGD